MNVLITGASSGIGAEVAKEFARRGFRLALLARRVDRLREVAASAAEAARQAGHTSYPEPLVLAADVADTDALTAAIAEAEATLPGGIAIAILNAGIGRAQRIDRFDAKVAAEIIDVNLTANVHAIGALLPGMIARRCGQIVGVSSLAAYRGLPSSAVYSASKAGLTTMLEGLRLDLKPFDIRVTTVSPGFVRSEMTAVNRFKMPFLLDGDDAARRIVRGVLAGRREVRFPWPLVLGIRALRAMPDALFDWLAMRLLPERRNRSQPPREAAPGDATTSRTVAAGEPSRAPACTSSAKE